MIDGIDLLDGLLLLTIFSIGFFIIKSDIRTKRIPNGLILCAISIGMFLYGMAVIVKTVSLVHFMAIILNAFISFVVGFLIWELGLWPAGDAKLFITFSFLIPFRCYSQTHLLFFPSFAFFINIFFVYLFFGVMKAVSAGIRWLLKQCGEKRPKWKIFMRYLRRKRKAVLRSITDMKLDWMWSRFFGGGTDGSAKWGVFLKIFVRLFMLSVLAMFSEKRSFHPGALSIYFIFFWFFRTLFNMFINTVGQKKIKVSEIQAGVNLSALTIKRVQSDTALSRGLDTLRAEGLTAQQANLIRECLSSKGSGIVYAYDTIPFSPFIFLGAVVTILLEGSVLYFLGFVMR